MNFKDSDFENAAANCSNTQLYKQAGNSIVRSVLMAIFSQVGFEGVKKWNDMTDEERYALIYGDANVFDENTFVLDGGQQHIRSR